MLKNNSLKDEIIPYQFHLGQNYPNPFKDKTIIKYCIAYKTRVKLTVYNSDGNEIEKLIDEEKTAGTYEIEFNASADLSGENRILPNGYYFYRMIAGGYSSEKKWFCINNLFGKVDMKTLIQTLFFFLLITQICFAQWYQQNSGTTTRLCGVSFTDANIGTAVGFDGTILRTTDGGTTWISQTSGTINDLYDVSFTDADNGTAVGLDNVVAIGKILRTTDGGTTWLSQTSGTSGSLFGVSFTDANTGTAVGGGGIEENNQEGVIIRTTNGGNSWITQLIGPGFILHDVLFTVANTGTAVGMFGTILRTTDGGTNWISQTSGTTHWLYGVSFTDANTGTVVGSGGTILRTTDGGANWIAQTSGTTNELDGVSFTDANTGTAVGRDMSGNGIILRTTDGGTTWISQTSGTTNWLLDVSFTDANTGWSVGEYGTILTTTNGGVPVELTSFTATTNGKEIILNWSTATELNNQGYEIERSEDNISFNKIGFVPGFGTTTEQHNYSYSDQSAISGTNYYRLKQVDYDGSYEYSDVVEVDFRTFNSYLLEQCYPNPFNPTTTIGFGIQDKSNVIITILNAIGEEVAVVLNEEREPGYHKVEFNAVNLPSGVYFYQLKAGSFIDTKKMILIK
jgi:photosystem II stability/assembly factor-like uncharacterized protein